MPERAVGVLGATSMVGKSLLPLLADTGWCVHAFSRQPQKLDQSSGQDSSITFRLLEKTDSDHASSLAAKEKKITHWICLAPIWVLPDYFSMLTAYQAGRVVALSSTSVFTKQNSSNCTERETAGKLKNGEQQFVAWAEASRIEWVILRPTMIYGLGRDRNICEIARFISRFGFFPLFGAAQGLRQPVHVEDVATACIAALQNKQTSNRAYNISGAETLTYREMVARVFKAMDKRERLVTIPLFVFRLANTFLRIWPRGCSWTVAMAERMNTDQVFAHAEAVRDLNLSLKIFQPGKVDLPISKSSNFQ